MQNSILTDDEPTQEVAPEIAEDIYSDLYDAQGEKGTLLKAKYAAVRPPKCYTTTEDVACCGMLAFAPQFFMFLQLQEQCHGQEATINKLRGRIEELLDVVSCELSNCQCHPILITIEPSLTDHFVMHDSYCVSYLSIAENEFSCEVFKSILKA